MISICTFCCLNNLILSCIRFCICNIFFNSTIKKPCVLQYHTKKLSNILSSHILYIYTINLNTSAINIIKSHKKIYHCSFPCTSRSYYCYFLSCFNICTKTFNNHPVMIIPKFNIFKLNIPLYILYLLKLFCTLFLFSFIQKFKDSFCRCCHRLKNV